MSNNSEQKEELSESRQQPENKLESIWDITKAIKEGDEKYAERIGVIADLLSDSNANLEKMISIGIEVENHLREIRAGVTAIAASANITDEEKEIRNEIDRILFERPPEWSASLMAWIKEYHGP